MAEAEKKVFDTSYASSYHTQSQLLRPCILYLGVSPADGGIHKKKGMKDPTGVDCSLIHTSPWVRL